MLPPQFSDSHTTALAPPKKSEFPTKVQFVTATVAFFTVMAVGDDRDVVRFVLECA